MIIIIIIIKGIFRKLKVKSDFLYKLLRIEQFDIQPPQILLMFSHNTCISEKLKDLKAQLDKSCTFRFMDPSILP